MITIKEKKDEFINAGSEIEKELYGLFKREDKIIIADIGACDGLSTIIYAKMFPNAHIHAFEPIVENASEMVANLQEYDVLDKVSVHLCALSDKNHIAKFHKSRGQHEKIEGWNTGNKSSSLLRPRKHIQEHPWCEFDIVEVNANRLDGQHIEKIDFAHIDVQGAELMVLKGGEKTFKTTKAIWIEVANIDLYAQQPLKAQIEHYMKRTGFVCAKDTCGKGKYGDMLWTRK